MSNFTINCRDFTARSSLYRVWVPLRDDGKAPLISIWIDPCLRAFDPCAEWETLEHGMGTNSVWVHGADSATLANSEDTDFVFPFGV
jgi:hypothetical protein